MSFSKRYAQNQLGVLEHKGTWNASINTPTLTSSIGDKGDYYIVSVAGTTNLDGVTDWQIGDWVMFSGSVWQKIDNSDEVKLDSPQFVGTPTAPTPDFMDNSNKIATTAFVKQVATAPFIDGGSPSSVFDSLIIIDGGNV